MSPTYLIGWDGTESAERALDFALLLADKLGARMLLWRAVKSPHLGGVVLSTDLEQALDEWLENKKHEVQKAVEERARQLAQRGFDLDREIWLGDVYEGLLDAAQRHRCDAIFLGRGKDPHRIGSLVLKILRSTRRPVVVVPEGYRPKELGRILIPIDLTMKDSSAVPLALDIASAFNARIDLLYVVEIYLYESPKVLQESINQLIQQELDEWQKAHMGQVQHIQIASHIRKDVDAASGILEFIHQEGVDLVVMDSHTRGPLMHLLLGSVAEKVVQRAPVPVVVTKPNL